MQPEILSRGRLNRATLARQLLLSRATVPVAEAAERIAGLQGQEPRPPFVGLWTRLAGFRREDLHAALHKRELVRATMMRGTLHVVSARDYAALRAPLRPMLVQGLRMLGGRGAGLDAERLLPVARDLLAERPLTFTELRPRLVEAFPDVDDRALGYAVRLLLPLVMIPTADRWAFPSVASFTPAESWLAEPLGVEPLGVDEDPRALVLRYLAAFGPASAADAQAWSGLGGLKGVLEELRPRLQVFRDERGRELFDLPDAARPEEDVPAPPRFLPEFDSLVLAHADRTRVLTDEHRGAVVTKNLRVRATFLLDGVVRGTWSVTRRRATATLRIAPFEALPARDVDALVAEGEALLRFQEEDAGTFTVEVAP